MAKPLFVRESTADEVRRLRRQAGAYDALLMRRLADRDESLSDLTTVGDIPGEETVLIDTALYHAASERAGRARTLVRRERLAATALALGVACALIRGRP